MKIKVSSETRVPVELRNDLVQVCIFAGYDPAYIFRKAKNLVRMKDGS